MIKCVKIVLGIKMIELLNEKDFDGVFKIMEESFPVDEFRPFDKQKELLKRKNYGISIFRDRKEIRGFIAIYSFEEFVFIEHLAVDKKYRGKKIGTALLESVVEKENKTICLEVELPTTAFAKRRIEFYEKNGFFLNGYEYFQPPISQGKNKIPLLIMSKNRPLKREEFEKIKDKLHKEVYGA